MNRREAIKNLILLTTGSTILPGFASEGGPTYENLSLKKGDRTFIELLANSILPREGTGVVNKESTSDYLLGIVDACYSPDEIQKFNQGLIDFKSHIRSTYQSPAMDLDMETRINLFRSVRSSKQISNDGKYFFDHVRRLTIEHFRTSEHYMTTVLNYEYAPGRYIGNKKIKG